MSFELLRDAVIAALDSSPFEKSKVSMAFERAAEDMAVVIFTRTGVEETAKLEPGEITDSQWISIKDAIEDSLGGDDVNIEHIVDAGMAIDRGDDDDSYDEFAGTMFDDSDPPEQI